MNIIGQVNISQSISRANSHLRYRAYRNSIGKPIPLSTALHQWCKRFIFEWLGIGQGA